MMIMKPLGMGAIALALATGAALAQSPEDDVEIAEEPQVIEADDCKIKIVDGKFSFEPVMDDADDAAVDPETEIVCTAEQIVDLLKG